MATTGADFLQGLNMILTSQQERERGKVQQSLAMMQFAQAKMQFAQEKKMQDIAVAKSNLEMATKGLESLKPRVAADFLTESGLSKFYISSDEGEEAETAITQMVKNLRHKSAFGKVLPEREAQKIATALWSYHGPTSSPDQVLGLARDLKSSVESALTADGGGTELYDAFAKLGADADLMEVTRQAERLKTSEELVHKERSDFLRGDYEMDIDINIYKDVKSSLGKLEGDRLIGDEEIDSLLKSIIKQSQLGEKSSLDKDEPWEPGVGTGIALIGSIAAAEGMAPHLVSEIKKYEKGYFQFMRQFYKDLRPERPVSGGGGLSSAKFKQKYPGLNKTGVQARYEPEMKRFKQLARTHARSKIKSVRNFIKAKDWAKNLKVTKRMKDLVNAIPGAGTLKTAAGYAPLVAGEQIGEAIGGDVGHMVGQGLGTATFMAFAAKKFPKRMAKFAAKAGGRHALASSGSIVGGLAAPVVAAGANALMLFVDAGLAVWEIKDLWNDWQTYQETGKI